jgi:hypothetical protein
VTVAVVSEVIRFLTVYVISQLYSIVLRRGQESLLPSRTPAWSGRISEVWQDALNEP